MSDKNIMKPVVSKKPLWRLLDYTQSTADLALSDLEDLSGILNIPEIAPIKMGELRGGVVA